MHALPPSSPAPPHVYGLSGVIAMCYHLVGPLHPTAKICRALTDSNVLQRRLGVVYTVYNPWPRAKDWTWILFQEANGEAILWHQCPAWPAILNHQYSWSRIHLNHDERRALISIQTSQPTCSVLQLIG